MDGRTPALVLEQAVVAGLDMKNPSEGAAARCPMLAAYGVPGLMAASYEEMTLKLIRTLGRRFS